MLPGVRQRAGTGGMQGTGEPTPRDCAFQLILALPAGYHVFNGGRPWRPPIGQVVGPRALLAVRCNAINAGSDRFRPPEVSGDIQMHRNYIDDQGYEVSETIILRSVISVDDFR